MKNSKDIRREFMDFFLERSHSFVPSSSLLPADDPTLLFTNAGMNQFKPLFLGTAKSDYARAVNSQKCIRAGGKHNDLGDVGRDTYHHTFFEMLGNWSFGDYFKADAIKWAWELLTDVWGIEKDRLYVTVFEGCDEDNLAPDTESERLWQELTDVDPSHIFRCSKKDNFWEMGETGPCGPCSEIHIDQTLDKSGGHLVNADDPRVIELWNLVFIQYNRSSDGALAPLQNQHVDTGLGFERICRVLQGKTSNYATDLFTTLIKSIEQLTDHRYGQSSPHDSDRFDSANMSDQADIACRVIADHARTLTFALSDGVIPSNEGRGYVLRRILRRAARYGRQSLNIKGHFLTKLVEVVVDMMGHAFPEIIARKDYVIETIASEEESFGKTLDRGIELFHRQAEKLIAAGAKQVPGELAFDLYATYGFPLDLTELMASEKGLSVDIAQYDDAMKKHRKASSASGGFKAMEIPPLPATDDQAKFETSPIDASVLGWVLDGKFISEGKLLAGIETLLVLDKTNFYGDSGGQVGDSGIITFSGGRFLVSKTLVAGDSILHVGKVDSGELQAGAKVKCQVDQDRISIMRNHSATHLLNWALRGVVGEQVNQAGSMVDASRLRFDFTCNRSVSDEELIKIEKMVNERILADENIRCGIYPLDDAMKIDGVRAVFGEKYPNPVRVVSIGTEDPMISAGADCAIEFCGGTHLSATSRIGLFKILAEESVAKGVRRITAVTGIAAFEWVQNSSSIIQQASATLRSPADEIPARIEAMQKQIKDLRKRPASSAGSELEIISTLTSPQGPIIIAKMQGIDVNAMRSICDQQRQKGAAAIFIGGADEEKVMLISMVCDELAKAKTLHAGSWVKAIAPIVGGGGGGKPTLAQAGGKKPACLDDALTEAVKFVKQQLEI